ncbi:MAG: hypothetical protein Q7J84_03915 [Sulfuricaulis sp.]|nr:hypothetical protein [Sulfuricaulis sp.]
MATIVGTRSALFYRKVAGALATIQDAKTQTGNVFFVDSAVGTDGGDGSTPDTPFATIDYAIGKCTANQGDMIVVLPGHAETTTAITMDKAGIKIVGLGEGASRPAITGDAVADVITVTSANVLIENLRFVTPTAAVTALINVAANRVTVRGCVFELGANIVDAITITAAGELPVFEDNEVVVTADGPDSWLKFEGVVDRPIIRRNHIVGTDGTNAFDDGVIDFDSVAVTNPVIYDNVFADNDVAVTVAANVGAITGEVIGPNKYGLVAVNVDNTGVTLASFGANSITAAAIAAGAIDAATFAAGAIDAAAIGAGAIAADAFAAGAIDAAAIANGAIDAATFAADAITEAKIADAALASEHFAASAGEKTTDGIVVTRATAALPQTTSAAIFTVTGHILLKRLVGNVTIAIGNVPNATKLKGNSTGAGATTDLCATLDIDNKAAGTRFEITGTFANAMVATVDVPLAKVQAADIVIPPGTIDLDCAGSDGGGGRAKWSVTYVPLEAGASVVAA